MTDSREALTPDPRGLEDARRAIKYSTPPTLAVAYFALAEHARAERLERDVRKYCNSTRDAELEAQINRDIRDHAESRITALEAQVATLREALELHEEMYQTGILNMTAVEVERVHATRRTALNTVDGDRT